MTCARLLADIDHRMVHITTQVAMGADKEEVVTEQYHALLAGFQCFAVCDSKIFPV